MTDNSDLKDLYKKPAMFMALGALALNATYVSLFLMTDTLTVLTYVVVAICLILAIGFGVLSLMVDQPDANRLFILGALFESCFVILQYFFAKTYLALGVKGVHDKWDALYFSIITWTTTGYGDLVPVEASRWVACCEALLGTLFNGLALAAVIYQLNLIAKPEAVGVSQETSK